MARAAIDQKLARINEGNHPEQASSHATPEEHARLMLEQLPDKWLALSQDRRRLIAGKADTSAQLFFPSV